MISSNILNDFLRIIIFTQNSLILDLINRLKYQITLFFLLWESDLLYFRHISHNLSPNKASKMYQCTKVRIKACIPLCTFVQVIFNLCLVCVNKIQKMNTCTGLVHVLCGTKLISDPYWTYRLQVYQILFHFSSKNKINHHFCLEIFLYPNYQYQRSI